MGAMLGSAQQAANLPTVRPGSATETAPRELSEAKPKRNKSKLGNVQRLTAEAIHGEFDRLLVGQQEHLTEVGERPCLEAAGKMTRCLRDNSQQACKCFSVMEVYRNCVTRATQERVDELADEGPPMMPMTPPQAMPVPSRQAAARSHRWWQFWHWFR
ncbi:uncharacterized protein DMAD_02252 [Drosophila madeirensis]|uniref:Uncharacterized protein n=1 Tax=Drosophila madeirensis TaxID=30013 RepID=A0AAU9G314_DROMD